MRHKRATMKNSTPLELASSFLRIKKIKATNKQIEQLASLYEHFQKNDEQFMKKQAALKNVVKMIEYNVDTFFVRRLIRSVRLGKAITLKKMLTLYSREGYRLWQNYVEAQRVTNSFEYKKEKFGMTESEFKEYNLSRSQTKENMVKRHGLEKGTIKWQNYVDRQSYAGVTKEYFIEKYGEDDGEARYKELNEKKANTLDSFIGRHGLEDGYKRYIDYVCKVRPGYSKISQDFCWKLHEKLDLGNAKCYFQELNREFAYYCRLNKRAYFFDFVITGNIKLAIEFHGDYFHANPKMYEADFKGFFFNKDLEAREIWKNDEIKQHSIENRGYRYLVVWENDFRENPDYEIQRCLNEIERIQRLRYN